uniref:Putative secreted protein n=1 Tax=Ixodes ricinus TaxID=34613 RepID=A0A6B0U3K6_IXORI
MTHVLHFTMIQAGKYILVLIVFGALVQHATGLQSERPGQRVMAAVKKAVEAAKEAFKDMASGARGRASMRNRPA